MRKIARAPYSNYRVGAAVALENGDLIGGCNIELSNYSLTCCAERVALFSAISKGETEFAAIAVATETGGTPCGSCRQVIFELCGNIPVFIIDNKNQIQKTSSGALLPDAFTDEHLPK